MIEYVRDQIKKFKRLSVGQFLFLSVSFWVLLAMSFFPYIPVEGDIFACWFQYVSHLERFVFGAALREAGSSGRYPGLPLTMAIIKNLFHLDFLNALAVMRFMFSIFFAHSIYYFLKHVFKFPTSSKWMWLFLIFPTFWGNALLNNQDCIKAFSFIYAISFFVRYLESGIKRHFVGCALFSMYLAGARSVDSLPFYVFGITYIYYFSNQAVLQKAKTAVHMFYPSILVTTYLHVFGKIKLGHWGLSGDGTSPDIWLSLASKHVQALSLGSNIQSCLAFLQLCAVVTSNKLNYFFTDYFYTSGTINLLDANAFFPNFKKSELFSYSLVGLVLLMLGVLIFTIFRKSNESALGRSMFLSGLSSAVFYTFILNHYEARYWITTFTILFFGLIFLARKIILKNYVFVPLIVFGLFNSYIFLSWKVRYNRQTLAEAKVWMKDAEQICEDPEIQQITLDTDYFRFSSYRYFVGKVCPRIKLHPSNELSQDLKVIKKVGVIELSSPYFKAISSAAEKL